MRADGRTVGYIAAADAPQWAGVVRRVVASGYVPVVPGRVYAFEAPDWDDWDGNGDPPAADFAAKIQLRLEDANTALPINDPPAVPYTLVPRSRFVQVTKEDDHLDALLPFVPDGGYGLLLATLHERSNWTSTKRPVVEVRVNNKCVGQLTPQMGQRFLPMVRHFDARGFLTACWADVTGSSVAAEVRIDAVKANEADVDVLDGAPVTVPRLLPALDDPWGYDLSRIEALCRRQPAAPYMAERRPRQRAAAIPAAAPLPPAGWYEDPRHSWLLRYWNGAVWTQHTARNPRA
ncbi:DUF2510 domain-containing protein [Mycobacterium canetti]|uniref:DUF2510 domain-containing protein n=1 Tax=Mycobacterium canetti TaxID=78331 RepID=UPI001E64D305|nr:DUF2510 domain-containing protein [Mycobacterium canetti]